MVLAFAQNIGMLVGLILELTGAIFLITPYEPRLRRFALNIPLRWFDVLNDVENYKKEAVSGVTISENSRGYDVVNSIFEINWGNTFREITFETGDNWHVEVTDNPREGYAIVQITGERPELQQFIGQAIEWRLLITGGLLLAGGFSLQIIVIIAKIPSTI